VITSTTISTSPAAAIRPSRRSPTTPPPADQDRTTPTIGFRDVSRIGREDASGRPSGEEVKFDLESLAVQIWLLAGLAACYLLVAWVILRRAMARA
jgi:hypothetical protein